MATELIFQQQAMQCNEPGCWCSLHPFWTGISNCRCFETEAITTSKLAEPLQALTVLLVIITAWTGVQDSTGSQAFPVSYHLSLVTDREGLGACAVLHACPGCRLSC